jgi:hypothetical protein
MALKFKKNVTLQGGIDIPAGSICQVDIKTNHIPQGEDELAQLIMLSFYRDQAVYPLEKMTRPKEVPFERFNILLTNEEFNNINGLMINEKAKGYIVANTSFEEADVEIISL